MCKIEHHSHTHSKALFFCVQNKNLDGHFMAIKISTVYVWDC